MPRILALGVVILAQTILAADWPMWQHDAGRSGSTPAALPDKLHLRWIRHLPAPEPCWEDPVNQDRMPFDKVYEPVVAGHVLVVGSNRIDAVTAYDTRTGKQLWQAVTDAPVRFPPAIQGNHVIAISDDGFCYAFALDNGTLQWRLRLGLDGRRVLGNGRLVSAWCARGGPVIDRGLVYVGAGIWPFMGSMLQAIDVETGQRRWRQENLGDLYLDQPHGGSRSFGGIAPQGALACTDQFLIVPNGRSVPAVLNRNDGTLVYFHLSGSPRYRIGGGVDRKLEGGSYVAANPTHWLNRRGLATTLYDLKTGGATITWRGNFQPVLTNTMLYLAGKDLQAFRLADLKLISFKSKVKDRKTGKMKTVTKQEWRLPSAWTRKNLEATSLMRAGHHLFVGGKGRILRLPDPATEAEPLAEFKVEGTVSRLLAADNRIFAVTSTGAILCFGPESTPAAADFPAATVAPPAALHPDPHMAALLDRVPLKKGWILLFDPPDLAGIQAVAARPGLRAICVVRDPKRRQTLRRELLREGLYGTRATVHQGTPETFGAPAYLALLTWAAAPKNPDPAWIDALLRSVRPYGGMLFLQGKPAQLEPLIRNKAWKQVRQERLADGILLRRQGGPEGAASWTHMYGDVANTTKSNDRLVRPPLGLLWFGGNRHSDVLPRHGHGPPEQVLGGRLFIEGIDELSARDVYTGAVLWKKNLGNLGIFGIYYDQSYKPNPLDTTYNQSHIPGANARGTNFVVTSDAVYIARGSSCLVLDPSDGHALMTIPLPPTTSGHPPKEWAYIGVSGNVLLGGTGFVRFSEKWGLKKGSIWENQDHTSSQGLAAFDRHSGALLWQRPARLAFRHNAVCSSTDTVFCIDALPQAILDRLRRRGTPAKDDAAMLALDLHTGNVRWKRTDKVFGTWLSYSAEHRFLIQTGRASRDMLRGEPSDRLMALKADNGDIVWDRKGRYGGPVMLHGDIIYLPAVNTTGSAVSLLNGEPLMRLHPLTRKKVPWSYHRRYGCNSVIAAEYMLTFRSGAAGFCDLSLDAGTGNFGGFKSGCTSNLIAADGVLNAPDYTRTCTCSYQNQTSLALIRMPDLDWWTANEIDRGEGRILELAVNLGAPGDRAETRNTLWFEFPIVGGPSPPLPVTIEPTSPETFHYRSAEFTGTLPWVAASGLVGERTIQVDLVPDSDRYRIVTRRIASAAADAEEAQNGTMIHGSSDLEMVQENTTQTVGLYFADIPFDAKRQLAYANVQFWTDETPSQATRLTIRAQAADNAEPFGKEPHDITRRPLTQAAVTWTVPRWSKVGEAGPAQRSPDVSPLINEVISRPGWKPGNGIVFVISGKGKRVAKSFEGNRAQAAKLTMALVKTKSEIAAEPPPPLYTVRLVFAEPDLHPGKRLFDVLVNDRLVIPALDPTRHPRTGIVRTFKNVPLRDSCRITLRPRPGSDRPPVICGFALSAQ